MQWKDSPRDPPQMKKVRNSGLDQRKLLEWKLRKDKQASNTDRKYFDASIVINCFRKKAIFFYFDKKK